MKSGEQMGMRAITRRKFLAALAMGGMAVMASVAGADAAHAGGKKPRRPGKRRRVSAQISAQPEPPKQKGTGDYDRIMVGWGGCNGCGQ